MPIPAPAPDRTCVVTGASSGIGAHLARQFAARGHGVTLVARRRERLEALADELSDRHGVRTEVVAADLADRDERVALVGEVAARGLTVDVLVNNAGFSTSGALAGIDPDREIAMLRTNVEAVDHLCGLVVPGMLDRRRGAVLNVASTASYQPLPGQAGYSASKAFVRAFSQALAAEVAGHHVTVTTLCPGPVDTEFADAAGLDQLGAVDVVPAFMWVSAEDVARRAVEGLEAGALVVVPGPANRVLAALASVTPRRLLLPALARLHPAMAASGGGAP